MSEHIKPIQKIIFGSPGTGKSYQIREIARDKLEIPFDEATKMLSNTVKTVFHPEYTYADFMGKLLPLTQGNSIIYKFYPGHFLRILGMAYRGLIEGKNDHYLLVIDELTRGNAAAIFGTVFQLLDRESDGWSSYEVDISDMELVGLLEVMGLKPNIKNDGSIWIEEESTAKSLKSYCYKKINDLFKDEWLVDYDSFRVFNLLQERRINIPHNLSIIATINTSDESIYYLDTAFKRRWDWEYVKAPGEWPIREELLKKLLDVKLIINEEEKEWLDYIFGINKLIKSNSQVIRRIEDKQIGGWFIKPENGKINLNQVKDKLMFYLWDSVFTRDKRPLEEFLSTKNKQVKLTSYADFLSLIEEFMIKVGELGKKEYF